MSGLDTGELQETLAQAVAAETALVPPSSRDHARFVRFLVTGGIAAGVNVATCWLLRFAMRYEVAIALAYLAGMTAAFVLARAYVFEVSTADVRKQYLRFALVNAIAFVQVWLVSLTLARVVFPAIGLTWQAETIAHVIGVISPVVTSYLGHKHFSFRA